MTEYADRTKLPQFFFTGARLAAPRDELRRLAAEAARSTLPGAAVFDGVSPDGWAGALRLLGSALPDGARDHRLRRVPVAVPDQPGP